MRERKGVGAIKCVCVSSVSNPRVGDHLPASESAGLPGRLVSVIRGPSRERHIHHAPEPQASEGKKREREWGGVEEGRKDPLPHPQPLISDL